MLSSLLNCDWMNTNKIILQDEHFFLNRNWVIWFFKKDFDMQYILCRENKYLVSTCCFACDSQHLEDFIFSSLPLGSVSVHAKLLQSCPTLYSPVYCSLPDSSVHGILQARILESIAMPSFRRLFRLWDQTCVSCGSCICRQILYH